MHELSIAMSLVDAAAEAATRLKAARVTAVHVRVGRLSGVVPDALRFSFDLVTDGTCVQGAELAIEVAVGRELELIALEVIDGDDAADCRGSSEHSEEERPARA